MKRYTYIKKKIALIIIGIVLVFAFCGCGSKPDDEQDEQVEETQDTDDDESDTKKPDKPDKTEAASKADPMEGDWEMVYNIYHSEYGTDGESYDGVSMSDDPYSQTSLMRVTKKDGKLIADYMMGGFESDYRFYGNELKYLEEAAYEGCENSEWCVTFTDPFEEESDEYSPMKKRFTLTDNDTLIGVSVYTDGNKGTDEYYYSVSTDVYYRKSDPRLEDRESIRYFNTVTVSNAEDLLNNIANNTKILLEAGTYDFSAVDESRVQNPNVYCDYGAYIVNGVSNFCIEAKDGANVLLCVDEAYDPVMKFESITNITFRGVTAGHNVEPGYCSGSVLEFSSGNGVKIDKCNLYGCGTYGIQAYSIENLEVTDTDIYECTYGLVDLTYVYNAHFNNCTLRDSKDMSMICVESCYDISFDNCLFKNNYIEPEYSTCYFVELSEYSDVTFTDCKFENNQYNKFANRKVKQINCNISDNGDPDMSNVNSEDAVDQDSLLKSYDDACTRQKEIDELFAKGNMDQQTMNQTAFEEYQLWDTLLNSIWGYLRNTLDEDTMLDLTDEQKQWIKEKEAAVKTAGEDFEGGSMQPMVEYGTGADYTRKRVEYLMGMYFR